MTREEFIKVLDRRGYSHREEGDKVVVTVNWDVDLRDLTSLPRGVVFKNVGNVYLKSLTSLPPGVIFRNGDSVYLNALTSLPLGVEFNNGWSVHLDSLTSFPYGFEFNNGGYISLNSLTGGLLHKWKGNIEGVNSKALLNKMIQDGLLEKRRR